MEKLTKAQHRWLETLRKNGFVERGYRFGEGQKNRPLEKLTEFGLARFGWGPEGSFLMVQGYFPVEQEPPQ